jgi:hypothetical protein
VGVEGVALGSGVDSSGRTLREGMQPVVVEDGGREGGDEGMWTSAHESKSERCGMGSGAYQLLVARMAVLRELYAGPIRQERADKGRYEHRTIPYSTPFAAGRGSRRKTTRCADPSVKTT